MGGGERPLPDKAPTRGFSSRLTANPARLNKTQWEVATWIQSHADEVIRLSITEVAHRTDVSEATVVRTAKLLGFSGYSQMKVALAQSLVKGAGPIHEAVEESDSVDAVVRKVMLSNASALYDTLNGFRVEELERAVAVLLEARKIDFYGIGASGLVVADACQRLVKIGLNAHAERDGHAQAIRAALLTEADVVVGVSHSGRSLDIVDALRIAREGGAHVITVTQVGKSPVERLGDIRLYTVARETAFTSEAMSSRIAQLSIFDALFVSVALKMKDTATASLQRARIATSKKRSMTD